LGMEWEKKVLEWSRKQRTKFLLPIGKFLLKLKIRAVYLTIVAFLVGVAAVYFLFRNQMFFFLLGVLHLFLDGLDGVVARASNSDSRLGAHIDNISDRLILVLVLVKSYFYFNDYFILVVLGLYVLHHLIYALSDLKGKVSYSRFLTMVIYFLGFYTLGFFAVGILSLYGLSLQFNSWVKKKFTT